RSMGSRLPMPGSGWVSSRGGLWAARWRLASGMTAPCRRRAAARNPGVRRPAGLRAAALLGCSRRRQGVTRESAGAAAGAPGGGVASGGAAPLRTAEAVIDPEERRSIEEVGGALQRAAASGKKVYLVGDGAPLPYERLREAGAVTVPLQGEGLRAAHVAHI